MLENMLEKEILSQKLDDNQKSPKSPKKSPVFGDCRFFTSSPSSPTCPKRIPKKKSSLFRASTFECEFEKPKDEQKNLENINCYSNEGGKWERSNVTIKENKLSIKFREPFAPRRGRINCSLNDNGKWRWFGTQFTIAKQTK